MCMYVLQVALYNTDQEGSDSPRSSLNNSLSDQSLASVNLNSVGSVHSYTPVRPLFTSSSSYNRGVEATLHTVRPRNLSPPRVRVRFWVSFLFSVSILKTTRE